MKSHKDTTLRLQQQKFKIGNEDNLGIPIPKLRNIAKSLKKNHALGLVLWNEPIHEAKILATMIVDPTIMTLSQMNKWIDEFYSWDICDQACGNVFSCHQSAPQYAIAWTQNKGEFQRRAGFAKMAYLATKSRKCKEEILLLFLPSIEEHLYDHRLYVKKATNWAIRQIGKKNRNLNSRMQTFCQQKIKEIHSDPKLLPKEKSTALWIINHAFKELNSKKLQNRLRNIN